MSGRSVYQQIYQLAKEELREREGDAGNDSRLAGN